MRCVAFVLVLLVPLYGASAKDKLVEAQLLADVAAIDPGRPFDVGVLLTIKTGWHVYWINPGDSGLATKVDFKLPAGFDSGPVRYPVPRRFDEPGGLVGYGYADKVMLLARVTPPKDLKIGSAIEISASMSWLSCEEVCIPGEAALSVSLPVAAESEPANDAAFRYWSAQVPVELVQAADMVEVAAARDGLGVDLRWKRPVTEVQWFPEPADDMEVGEIKIETSDNESRVRFRAEPLAGTKAPRRSLGSVVGYVDQHGHRAGVRLDVPIP